MSDVSNDFFQDFEIHTDSNASSSSAESNYFPSLTDLSSDDTSVESMSNKSPAWNNSILNLFEDFVTDDCGLLENIRNNVVANDGQEKSVPNVSVSTGGGFANHDHPAHIETLSYILSNESTFCFDDTMLLNNSVELTENSIPGADLLVVKEDQEIVRDHCMVETDSSHMVSSIDNRLTTSSNENTCKSATRTDNTGSINAILSDAIESTSKTADEWNVAHCDPDVMADCIRDSGFDDAIEDILDSTQNNETSKRHREIQERICELLQQIEQSVREGIPLTVRRKPSWQTCSMQNGILQTDNASLGEKIIKPIDSRKLQLMVQLLATIYQLLATGTSCTKRELYYLHLELAQSSYYTYAVLEDVCALLDADAWEVNVFNTSKGLLAGPLVLKLACGQTIDCNSRWGVSVPLDVGSVVELRIDFKLVLVVEKDTVFKRLLEDGILEKFSNKLLLITGKGYPDVSTRLLLRKIADEANVPIYGLMDADPHGIEIFCVYKFGSLAMAYQQRSLAVPTMRWIGLFPSDIELLGLQGVPLRETELKKIALMIKRPYTEGIIQRELLFLRQLATKAEIESLYNIASDFVTTVYLTQKFKEFRSNL